MLTQYWMRRVILCSSLVLALPVMAADPLPLPTNPPHTRPPFVYHYDPQLPEVDWQIPAGWGRTIKGVFRDDVSQDKYPWHWETEWRNPGDTTIVLPIIFVGPNPLFPQARILTLPPKRWAVVEFIFDERPETGRWRYTMTAPANPAGPKFEHDCSVCEDPPEMALMEPNEVQVRSVAEVEAMPHIRVEAAVENPTVSQWGLITLALLLVVAGATMTVRRSRRAAA